MNICVFGDSIAWGACDYKNGGWVARLRNYFEERGDTPLGISGVLADVLVYNLGISGDNTDDLLERIESECKTREPNMIVIAIGINDSQYVRSERTRRVPLQKFQKNISNLYKIAKLYSEKIAFIGLTNVDESKTRPIPWNTDEEYDNKSIREYNEAIKKFCSENNLKFIEMNNVLEKDDLEDGLHPNSQGHEKMFEKIKPEIEKLPSA